AAVLLLGYDLQQDGAGDIPLGLLVDDHEVHTLKHERPDVVEGYVTTLDRVVQPPVRILLNSPRFIHRTSFTMSYAPSLVRTCRRTPYYNCATNPTSVVEVASLPQAGAATPTSLTPPIASGRQCCAAQASSSPGSSSLSFSGGSWPRSVRTSCSRVLAAAGATGSDRRDFASF